MRAARNDPCEGALILAFFVREFVLKTRFSSCSLNWSRRLVGASQPRSSEWDVRDPVRHPKVGRSLQQPDRQRIETTSSVLTPTRRNSGRQSEVWIGVLV